MYLKEFKKCMVIIIHLYVYVFSNLPLKSSFTIPQFNQLS